MPYDRKHTQVFLLQCLSPQESVKLPRNHRLIVMNAYRIATFRMSTDAVKAWVLCILQHGRRICIQATSKDMLYFLFGCLLNNITTHWMGYTSFSHQELFSILLHILFPFNDWPGHGKKPLFLGILQHCCSWVSGRRKGNIFSIAIIYFLRADNNSKNASKKPLLSNISLQQKKSFFSSFSLCSLLIFPASGKKEIEKKMWFFVLIL